MLESLQDILTYALYFICPLLIILVLLQGVGGDVSSAFGGGGQLDSTLGIGANRKMATITGVLSVLFIVAVLIIGIPVSNGFAEDVDQPPAITSTDEQPVEDDTTPPDMELIESLVSSTSAATVSSTAAATGGSSTAAATAEPSTVTIGDDEGE